MEPDSETRGLVKDVGALVVELDGIKRDMRRGRVSKTLAEAVEWEREFGDEMTAKIPGRLALPRDRVTFCRRLARQYGVSHVTVRDAFAAVWV